MSKAPKLRFKEFSGDWESENTLNMLKERKGSIKIGPFGSALKKEFYVDNGIKVYAQENVFKNNFELGDYYITDEKYETLKSCELVPGDLVISMMGTIGSCAIFPQSAKKGIMNSHLLRLQFKYKYSTELIAQLLKQSPLIKKQIKRLSVGSIMEGLSSSVVQQLIFTLPDIKEQEKIASFFSLIDDKISLQSEKVEALKDYKRGMMQNIFSRELRFKDDEGRDYPEWEEKKLEDIADCLDNKRKPLNSNERADMQGNIPYYGSNGVVDFVNNHIFDEDIILLAEDGGNFDDFATKPIAQLVKGKSWVNNHAHVLKAKYCTEFLFYSLVHKDIRKYINGTSRAKLNKSDMLDIVVNIPKSLEEQKKIADILGAIYLKIEKEEEKLDSLNEYKKGLLQQMFV